MTGSPSVTLIALPKPICLEHGETLVVIHGYHRVHHGEIGRRKAVSAGLGPLMSTTSPFNFSMTGP